MNSIIKLLFYKTYEDRLSKLKIISFLWFILWLILFIMMGYGIGSIFGAIMMTIPLFSIGLIIRILFIDKDEDEKGDSANVKAADSNENKASKADSADAKAADSNKEEDAKSDSAEVKAADSNENEEVKTIDDAYKEPDSSDEPQETYMEKDNVGTRQDTLAKANGYWLGTRLQMDEKPPFSLYIFNSAEDAENALLELPFIHKAQDTKNLICDKVLEFGYYKVEDGEYEAIITGFDLSLDEFNMVEESFKKHGGKLKNNLEPSGDVKSTESVEGDKNNVKFRETLTQDQYTYECYDGKTKADAMEFLKDKEVTKGLYYVCVYTPEGNFGRDINGIYEM